MNHIFLVSSIHWWAGMTVQIPTNAAYEVALLTKALTWKVNDIYPEQDERLERFREENPTFCSASRNFFCVRFHSIRTCLTINLQNKTDATTIKPSAWLRAYPSRPSMNFPDSFLHLRRPFDSCDIFDVLLRKSSRCHSEDRLQWAITRRWRPMTIWMKVVLDFPNDSHEKSDQNMSTISKFIFGTSPCLCLNFVNQNKLCSKKVVP
jgi:hypothetical protein